MRELVRGLGAGGEEASHRCGLKATQVGGLPLHGQLLFSGTQRGGGSTDAARSGDGEGLGIGVVAVIEER